MKACKEEIAREEDFFIEFTNDFNQLVEKIQKSKVSDSNKRIEK